MAGGSVAELGEAELIRRITSTFGEAPRGEIWAGDDAATFQWAEGDVVVTTDLLVEDVDFRLEWTSGYDLGFKAIAVNVSDIAAMGATPVRAVATLGLHPSTQVVTVEDMARGMRDAAAHYAVGIVGGT